MEYTGTYIHRGVHRAGRRFSNFVRRRRAEHRQRRRVGWTSGWTAATAGPSVVFKPSSLKSGAFSFQITLAVRRPWTRGSRWSYGRSFRRRRRGRWSAGGLRGPRIGGLAGAHGARSLKAVLAPRPPGRPFLFRSGFVGSVLWRTAHATRDRVFGGDIPASLAVSTKQEAYRRSHVNIGNRAGAAGATC